MTEIEIGNVVIMAMFAAGFLLICAGWYLVPSQLKKSVVAVGLMFVGWHVLQYIAENIIVIAK
jgi:hypothetical protein